MTFSLAGILGPTTSGAMMGNSVGGPWGAAAGGGLGLLSSLFGQAQQDNSGIKAQKQLRDQIRTQQEYTKASVDPNHPWNVGLTNQLKEQMQQEAAHSIIANLIQQQRARARGYTGAVNPARQDEAMSGQLMKAYMQAGNAARDEASRRLAAAGGSPTGNLAVQHAYTDQATQQQYATNQTGINQAASLPYIGAGLYGLFQDMFGGSGTEGQVTSPVATTFSNSPWMVGNTAMQGTTV